MKIAYISPNSIYPYDSSGAEKTIYELMEYLAENHVILSLCTNEKFLLYKMKFQEVISKEVEVIREENFTRIFFHSIDSLWEKGFLYLKEFMPDIIFTQLCDVKFIIQMMEMCNSKVKIVYYIHGNPERDEGYLKSLSTYYDYIEMILCVSEYVYDMMPMKLKEKSKIVYPLFGNIRNMPYYTNPLKYKRLIFFNPIKEKGVEIVKEISKKLNMINFDVYETWYSNGYRRYFFGDNIHIKEYERDIFKIFSNSYIYMLPSQLPEGLGRGIIEAGAFGIPSLASDLSGMKRNICNEKYLIKNYCKAEEWIEAINVLISSEDAYKKASTEVRIYSKMIMEKAFVQVRELLSCF